MPDRSETINGGTDKEGRKETRTRAERGTSGLELERWQVGDSGGEGRGGGFSEAAVWRFRSGHVCIR